MRGARKLLATTALSTMALACGGKKPDRRPPVGNSKGSIYDRNMADAGVEEAPAPDAEPVPEK